MYLSWSELTKKRKSPFPIFLPWHSFELWVVISKLLYILSLFSDCSIHICVFIETDLSPEETASLQKESRLFFFPFSYGVPQGQEGKWEASLSYIDSFWTQPSASASLLWSMCYQISSPTPSPHCFTHQSLSNPSFIQSFSSGSFSQSLQYNHFLFSSIFLISCHLSLLPSLSSRDFIAMVIE